ncbi:Family of unknown function (DUF648) [Chlamydia serpentis]|uniref:Uncharacterized protein n=1 Tax=Chlamydia serpentis TaxID=1967782 RepID=A0A2R8FAD5_9CHLA|nr:DUF648 domain-containing protein [Chlamydia serpentis]SPN73364.1 Family of unknown function (DUF648) [Chlamydia serpentis]
MISFFSPIIFEKKYFASKQIGATNPGILESLVERVDRYFDLGCINSTSCIEEKENIIFFKRVKSEISTCGLILRLISYLLVITVVIALIFKCVLRAILHLKYNFRRIPEFSCPADSYLETPVFQFTSEERQEIVRSHQIVRDHIKFSREELEAYGIKLITSSQGDNGVCVYTHRHFPHLIFKSVPIDHVEHRLAAFKIAKEVVTAKNLNLLHLPETTSLNFATTKDYSGVVQKHPLTCGLIVEERLELMEPANLQFKDSNVHPIMLITHLKQRELYQTLGERLLPTLKQLKIFIRETRFFDIAHRNLPVLKRMCLDSLSGAKVPVLGLVDIESLNILPWEKHNQSSLGDLYRMLIGILPPNIDFKKLLSEQEMRDADRGLPLPYEGQKMSSRHFPYR